MEEKNLKVELKNEIERAQRFLPESFKACPVDSIKGTQDALDECDVFVWCDEVYIVDESYDSAGIARYMNGEMASNRFYWKYQDEFCYKIGSISRADLDKLIESQLAKIS